MVRLLTLQVMQHTTGGLILNAFKSHFLVSVFVLFEMCGQYLLIPQSKRRLLVRAIDLTPIDEGSESIHLSSVG